MNVVKLCTEILFFKILFITLYTKRNHQHYFSSSSDYDQTCSLTFSLANGRLKGTWQQLNKISVKSRACAWLIIRACIILNFLLCHDTIMESLEPIEYRVVQYTNAVNKREDCKRRIFNAERFTSYCRKICVLKHVGMYLNMCRESLFKYCLLPCTQSIFISIIFLLCHFWFSET